MATKAEIQRDHVAREILESEKKFVESMTTLVEVFIKPLRAWSQELKANYGKGSMHPTLPENLLPDIFANVEQLLVFNQHLVEQFSEIYGTTKALGGFFKKAAPFFKMYSSYVSNYDRAMETLMQTIETRLDFASFVRACELQAGCKGLNLRAYLIMPVQRPPRYKLLLLELLKHTPQDHKDYQDLVAAVAMISEVVNSINEDIKRQERRFKVVEVQEKFDVELVTASRTFVKEGELIKMCRKGPKRFIFVLFNDLLVYGSGKMGSDKYALHRKLELNEVYLIDSGESERSFIIAGKAKSFVVQCKDLTEKREWVDAFRGCFADFDKARIQRYRSSDGKLTLIQLWMVREGNMARETYSLPEVGDKSWGVIQFSQLRLIVDPQQAGQGDGGGGLGQRMRSFFRAGSVQRIGPEAPVPCENVNQAGLDDDSSSIYTDVSSPSRSEAAPSSPPNQADLLGLCDIYPSQQGVPVQARVEGTHASVRLGAEVSQPIPSTSRPTSRDYSGVAAQASSSSSSLAQIGAAMDGAAETRVTELQQQQLTLFEQEFGAPRRQSMSRDAAPAAGGEMPFGSMRPDAYMARSSVDGRKSSMGGEDRRRSSTGHPLTPIAGDASPMAGLQPTGFNSGPVVGMEYVAVIPVTEMGLGLFLKDEQNQVVIGGFRAPRNGMGVNPSERAGVRLGDYLVRVNGVPVSSVAATIAALRESRQEQVIALTLRRSDGAALKKSVRVSPSRTFKGTGKILGP